MMNKKLFITDLILFFGAIILFCFFSVINNYFEKTSMIVDICISVICVLLILVLTVFNYRKVKSVSKVNVLSPFVLMILLYGLYHLPLFDFIAKKGIHNGICGLFVFTLFSRFALNLEKNLSNNQAEIKSINSKSLTFTGTFGKILKIYAIFILIGGIALALINAFFPVIDMSTPYQLVILQKSLAEIAK